MRAVVVDVIYDHFLTRHWSRYCEVPLPNYLAGFHQAAVREASDYPEGVGDFLEAIAADGRLGSYGTLEGVTEALMLVDRRLSERVRRRESTVSYLPRVEAAYEGLEGDFLEFFPEVMAHAGVA